MPTIYLETNPPDATGGRYGVFHNDDTGQVWSPVAAAGAGALATYTTSRDDFDVGASQDGVTGQYGIAVPANLPAGNYTLVRYREDSLGVKSHAADHREARQSFYWDGVRIWFPFSPPLVAEIIAPAAA